MLDDPLFFLLAIPAVVFAGVSKGGFGSGAAFAAAPLLALVVEPGLAVGVMLPLLMLIDAVTLKPYWKRWSWPDARLLILGGIPGVALGAAMWRVAPEDLLRFLIGAIALAFVVWQLWGREALVRASTRILPAWVGWTTGVVAGFTSFVSHAGGPPLAVYLLSRGLGKTTYQATTVLVFGAVNLAKALPYALLGLFTSETLIANLWLSPFALLGAWVGVKAHYLVPERVFFAITYLLLTGAGSKLIWDAMT